VVRRSLKHPASNEGGTAGFPSFDLVISWPVNRTGFLLEKS